MKKAHSQTVDPWAGLDPETVARLKAVAEMPEESIDLTDPDAPEQLDWSGAVPGKYYKPVKTLKSLRLDADVVAHFKAQGRGYQTRINDVLRRTMIEEVLAARRQAAKERREKERA